MNNAKLSVCLLSALLLSGCVKQEPPVASSSPATPAAVSTPVGATSTPAESRGSESALSPILSLDLASSAELPAGITKVADQKGRDGQALAFTGESSKIEVPWDISVEKFPKLTITAWARFTGDPEGKGQFQIVSHDNGEFDRSLGIDSRAGEWGWSAFAGSAGVIGGLPIVANEWVFLAVSYDETEGVSRLTVGDATTPAKEASHLGAGQPFVWIGGNPSFGEHFVGDIAHVQVFDRVLTDEELKAVREQ